ncbi:MAG TPA: hypothetical protein VIH20_01410, partial [Candidatus Subteraquimicrobiales bacterium]
KDTKNKSNENGGNKKKDNPAFFHLLSVRTLTKSCFAEFFRPLRVGKLKSDPQQIPAILKSRLRELIAVILLQTLKAVFVSEIRT